MAEAKKPPKARAPRASAFKPTARHVSVREGRLVAALGGCRLAPTEGSWR
jgi:hypothetical protein